jgi:hypothetical protein
MDGSYCVEIREKIIDTFKMRLGHCPRKRRTKMTKTFLLAAALALAATAPAKAKIDEACMNEMTETFGYSQAKRICDRNNYYDDYAAKRGAMGWHCDGGGGTPYKAPGGAKRKSDAVCE